MRCVGGSFDDPRRKSTSKWLAVSGVITVMLFLARIVAIAASPETQDRWSVDNKVSERANRFKIVAGTGISFIGFFVAFVSDTLKSQ